MLIVDIMAVMDDPDIVNGFTDGQRETIADVARRVSVSELIPQLIEKGTQSTLSGSYYFYADEILQLTGTDILEDKLYRDELLDALMCDESVSDAYFDNDSIGVYFYTKYCPNVEEDEDD